MRRLFALLFVGILAAGLASCSEDKKDKAKSSDSQATTTTTAKEFDDTEIIAALNNFLEATTAADKILTVENGDKIEAILQQSIDKLAGANPNVVAYDVKITLDGPDKATFTFDLASKDDPNTGLGLSQAGDAVQIDDTWFITAETVCDLTALGDPTLGEQCLNALEGTSSSTTGAPTATTGAATATTY
jgi:hypothetical protein